MITYNTNWQHNTGKETYIMEGTTQQDSARVGGAMEGNIRDQERTEGEKAEHMHMERSRSTRHNVAAMKELRCAQRPASTFHLKNRATQAATKKRGRQVIRSLKPRSFWRCAPDQWCGLHDVKPLQLRRSDVSPCPPPPLPPRSLSFPPIIVCPARQKKRSATAP